MAKAKTVVKTAAEIKAAWVSNGEVAPPTNDPHVNTLVKNIAVSQQNMELLNQNIHLTQQIEALTDKLDKSKSLSANIRAFLDTTLAKHGIKAAFEPLIEMAIERWPDDFKIVELQGEFKCNADQRIKIWTEILSYQLPKLKAMEVSGTVDNSITVMVRRFGGGDAIVERAVKQATVAPTIEQAIEVPAETEIVKRTFTHAPPVVVPPEAKPVIVNKMAKTLMH